MAMLEDELDCFFSEEVAMKITAWLEMIIYLVIKIRSAAHRAFDVTRTPSDLRPSSGSASKVFNIVELLEQVLVYLDLSDLAQFRRVCQLWNDVIQASSVLRQKRFVEPVERSEWMLQLQYGKVKSKMVAELTDDCRYWEAFMPSTLHPALQSLIDDKPTLRYPFACHFGSRILGHNFSIKFTIRPRSLARRLNYVTCCSHNEFLGAVLQSETGLTFQDLVDFARARIGRNEHCETKKGLDWSTFGFVEMIDTTPANTEWVEKARARYEREKARAERKQASKELRKAINEGKVADQSELLDLSSLFDQHWLQDCGKIIAA